VTSCAMGSSKTGRLPQPLHRKLEFAACRSRQLSTSV
jgi:hypothetical protein